MNVMKKHAGFTIIELIIIIVLVVSMGLSLGDMMSNPEDELLAEVISDLYKVNTALAMYREHHSAYPTTAQGLDVLIEKPSGLAEPFLKKVPLDPWGNPYNYSATNMSYEVYSYGADGKKGGEGINRDINLEDR